MKIKSIIPVLMAAAAMSTHAAVVATDAFNDTSRTFYSASTADLIQNGAATLTSGPTISSGTYTALESSGKSFELSNLNDGSNSNNTGSSLSTGYDSGDSAVLGTFNYATDFSLNTTTNTAGYDLTSIVITSNASDRRVNQNIEIYYNTVSDPTFQLLKAYTSSHAATSNTTYSLQVTVTEDAGDNILATGVKDLRFRILTPASYNSNLGGTVFSEIDAFGTPTTIPEPSALLLSALGFLAFLRRKR